MRGPYRRHGEDRRNFELQAGPPTDRSTGAKQQRICRTADPGTAAKDTVQLRQRNDHY